MPAAPTPPSAVPLESKLAFLRQPGSYPEAVCLVEAIETHMSWVFLTEQHAYKLKKPVRYGILDFTALDARRFYCDEEIRLNRRLAPAIYLGSVALTIDTGGHLHVGGSGTVVDWLVKMRRLPEHRMLDYALRTGAATTDDMRRIAVLLADFYRHCEPIAVEPPEWRATFAREIEETARGLCLDVYQLPPSAIRETAELLLGLLHRKTALFDRRIAVGRIVEGHGDLRPEHVFLGTPLAVIDCLEFSRNLRILDSADEIGFLALECERLGAARLGLELLRHYRALSGDRPEPLLLHFYQAFRASLRARIAIRHLDEAKFRYSVEWPRRAHAYLRLALRHARRCRRYLPESQNS